MKFLGNSEGDGRRYTNGSEVTEQMREDLMKRALMGICLTSAVAAMLVAPFAARAADAALEAKVDSLAKEVASMKNEGDQKAGKFDWLTIGGDYRFRIDSLKGTTADHFNFLDPAFQAWMMGPHTTPPPMAKSEDIKNDTIYSNRLGLNLKAKVTKDVSLTTRFLMYKTFGNSDSDATSGMLFGDRAGQFDGTQGHTPGDDKLVVDQAYVTWSNIFDQPVWFSVGRRPSTGGIPAHLRADAEKPGNGGIPAILVDYAFDGMVLGVAPDFDALPGAYGKICYGRGYEAGYRYSSIGTKVKDMDMLGVSLVPIDIDPLYLNLQWNRGFNIVDAPVMATSAMGPTAPSTNVGDIDWYGATVLSTLKNIGPGTLNVFAAGAGSVTHPNSNLSGGMAGLLYNAGDSDKSRTGLAAYVGARYDVTATRTKLGLEYNHGSKYWVAMDPASDDMWTAKLGTRGDVFEGYVIQELPGKAVASYNAKAFFRIGYQYYRFDYTGSNSWMGKPVKIADLDDSPMNAQMFNPLKNAQDIYGTFEVRF